MRGGHRGHDPIGLTWEHRAQHSLADLRVRLGHHRGRRALEAAWKAIEPVIQAGGLVTLLWHNDCFNEPEYADWQWCDGGIDATRSSP